MKKIITLFCLLIYAFCCNAQRIVFDYNRFEADSYYTDPSNGRKYVYLNLPYKVYGFKGKRLNIVWRFTERDANGKERILPGSILATKDFKENGQLCSVVHHMDIPLDQKNYSSYSPKFRIPRDYFPRYAFEEFSGFGHVHMYLVITDTNKKEVARSKTYTLDLSLDGDKPTLTKYLNEDWMHPDLEREESDGIVYQEQRKKCWSCHGTSNCSLCRGLGTVMVGLRNPYPMQCTLCYGLGKCKSCNGGYITITYKYYLNIDKNPDAWKLNRPNWGSYDATGSRGSSSSSGSSSTVRDNHCRMCIGLGSCQQCSGSGRNKYNYDLLCSTCKGSGQCRYCSGTGKK